MQAPKDSRSGMAALAGVGLIVLGFWLFLRSSGIVPDSVVDLLQDTAGAVTLIVLGVVVLLVARKVDFQMPRSGTRLYRSREDRWLGGVLGGLGRYLGIDPLVLRVAVILLTVVGVGSLIIAYIVMWVLVPEEPMVTTVPPSA